MSYREELEALVEDFASRLREIGGEMLEEIGATNAEADANVRRHQEISAELENVEGRAAALSSEIDGLPAEVSRADLEGDHDLEDRLRERYAEAKAELEGLERGRSSLASEAADLEGPVSHRFGRHPHDAPIRQYAKAAAVAHEMRAAMEGAKEAVERAAKEALEPVENAHRGALSATQALASDRDLHYRTVGPKDAA